MGNLGSWEVTVKLLVTFYQLRKERLGGVLSDPHSHWALYWLPLAWPALWVGTRDRFCIPQPRGLEGTALRACGSAAPAVAAGTWRAEHHLAREAKPLGPGSCTLQDNAGPSLGSTQPLFP